MGNTSGQPTRLHALDGLRGLSAVVVLLSHVFLTFPAFAAAVYATNVQMSTGTVEWLVTYTPLHILWAGHEAVFVFFVLSGLVLTLPAIKSNGFSWRAYYPKRLIRLYVPVAGAVVFGVAMVLLVPRNNATDMGAWLQARPAEVTWSGAIKDLVLVIGPSRLISPLWSLQWEMLFSLLLPLYVLFATVRAGSAWLKAALVFASICLGVVFNSQFLTYMAMFAAGSLVAKEIDHLRRALSRLKATHWCFLGGMALVLATARWTLTLFAPNDFVSNLSTIPAFLGCLLLVIIASFCPGTQRLLQSGPLQWFGKISFSLYLTHEPIVIATAFFFGRNNLGLVPLIAIPVAFVVALLFFKFIEAPSHALSVYAGNRFKPRTSESILLEAK